MLIAVTTSCQEAGNSTGAFNHFNESLGILEKWSWLWNLWKQFRNSSSLKSWSLIFYILFISYPSKTPLLKLLCPPTSPEMLLLMKIPQHFPWLIFLIKPFLSFFFPSLLYFLRAVMVSWLTICPKPLFLLHSFMTKDLMTHSDTKIDKTPAVALCNLLFFLQFSSAGCYTF